RPLPDSFFVCGPAGERLLRADEVRQSIQQVGPQRHASMLRYMRNRPNRNEIRRSLGLSPGDQVLLVGIAIVEAETAALLDAVYEACCATGHRVLVRTHPNRPRSGEAVAASLARWEEGRARILSGGSLYEQLDAADAAVMIGSTAAFEAMALGTMPIIFEFRGTYPATSLREYEDGLYTAADALELRAALDEISAPLAEGALRRAAAWPRLVEDVFGDLQGSLAAQFSAAVDNM
ncbi:MAG: hypothetical protein M3403_07905, partial [Gemmatimonadota bacterium]|nr:hypothetical protein [Gemmatimonadota bacterium]